MLQSVCGMVWGGVSGLRVWCVHVVCRVCIYMSVCSVICLCVCVSECGLCVYYVSEGYVCGVCVVCVYVCGVYTRASVYMWSVYVCACVPVYMCVRLRTCVHVGVCMCRFVCVCAECIYIRVHLCVCTWGVRTRIHVGAHACMHVGGCTRVRTWGVYVCVWGVGGVRGGTASPICRLLLGGRIPMEGTTTPRVLGSVGYGGKTHRPHGTTPATHSGCSRGEHSHHHHHYCRQGGERPSRARCAHLHVLCARFPAPKPRRVPAQPRPTPIPWCVGCTARPRPRACPPHQSIRKVRARCAPGRLRRRRVGALSRQRPRPL